MTKPDNMGLHETIARTIASHLGYDYDNCFANKSEWVARGGMDKTNRFWDVNSPYQCDFDEAAEAVGRLTGLPPPTLRTDPEVATVSDIFADRAMKPDDIPQEVWSAALAALPEGFRANYETTPILVVLHLGIAQAIMAEREACAFTAERHGQVVSNEPIGQACSRNIAAAIRNRSPA